METTCTNDVNSGDNMEQLKQKINALQTENAHLLEYFALAKENQTLKEQNERLKLEEAALIYQIQSAKKTIQAANKPYFQTATLSSGGSVVHVSRNGGELDPEGEGPNMHLGLPCSNADEIRKYEKDLANSWKDFVARGYKNQ